jgi:hypothetical protein
VLFPDLPQARRDSCPSRLYDGGAPELDFGSPTNSVLVLASADVKGFHCDANAAFNLLSEGPVRRGQFGQTLSISHPIAGKFSLSGALVRANPHSQ